jgi:hypothetical protein
MSKPKSKRELLLITVDDPEIDEIARGSSLAPRRIAAVNSRVDIIEYEFRRGRLSREAYRCARALDHLFDHTEGKHTRVVPFEPRPKYFASGSDHKMAARFDAAARFAHLLEAIEGAIGDDAARLLFLIIGRGLSFRALVRMRSAQVPAKPGKGRDREREAALVGREFRAALERLSQRDGQFGKSLISWSAE